MKKDSPPLSDFEQFAAAVKQLQDTILDEFEKLVAKLNEIIAKVIGEKNE